MPQSLKETQSPFERAVSEGLTGQRAVVGNSNSNSNVERRARGPRPHSAGDWAPDFIRALMEGASIRHATRVAGVDITMPYKRRAEDEEFRAAWNRAAEIGTELLEQEAQRRAYHGTLKPVFQRGVQVGLVREYSDVLLMFLLKKRDPSYRDSSSVTVNNTNQVSVANVFDDIERDSALILDAPQADAPAPRELPEAKGERT
jgi:hypothetical protein